MTDWLLAFIAVFVLDLCWTFYVKSVQNSEVLKSGLWAAVLFVTAGFATLFYVKDPWLLIPSAIGAFAGTSLAVFCGKEGFSILDLLAGPGTGPR